MADRLHPARLELPAARKIRMVDFETGKADLRAEHKAWLDETVRFLRPRERFWIYIYGYASKLARRGARNAQESRLFNVQLSYERASTVARYLEQRDPRVSSRVREFSARGCDSYNATLNDNSAVERAVEVHVHLSYAPPKPPPQVDPLRPLPGGRRYSSWAIAVPFGASVTVFPGVVAAANVIVFRCREQHDETHAYLTPGVGGGVSYSGPSLSRLKEILKNILGSLSYSGMSFTNVIAATPFNFGDLDGATCEVRQAGAGAGPGHLFARASARGQVWHRESSGKAFFGMRDLVKDVNVSGKDLQLGAGASAVGGPMIRVD